MTPTTDVPKTPMRPEKKKRTAAKIPQAEPDFSFLDGLTEIQLKAVKNSYIKQKNQLKDIFDTNAIAIKSLQDQVAHLKAAQKNNCKKRGIVGLHSRAVNLRIRDMRRLTKFVSGDDDTDPEQGESDQGQGQGDQDQGQQDQDQAEAEAETETEADEQPVFKKKKQ